MFDPTVDDLGSVDAALHRIESASHFGQHAAGDDAVLDQALYRLDVQRRDQLALPVEQAGGIGEEHQLLRLERLRELARHEIGVDVVGHAVVAHADRRDDRDEVAARKECEHPGVDARDLADMPDIDDLGGLKFRMASGHGELAGPNETAVFPGEPDRFAAVPVDEIHDLLVDEAAEHHLDHVHGFGVGDAHAVDEPRLLADPIEQLADLRAAAMHDDRAHSDQLHQDDVTCEAALERIAFHRRSAVLDDDGPALKPLNVRQRLGEDFCGAHCRLGISGHGAALSRRARRSPDPRAARFASLAGSRRGEVRPAPIRDRARVRGAPRRTRFTVMAQLFKTAAPAKDRWRAALV